VATSTRTALVTGATAGIGAAFTHRLAADGWGLVLVARDAARLDGLALDLTGRYGVPVEVLSADLSTDDGPGPVADRLRDAARPVDLLINNAGIGLRTPFSRADVEDEARMMRLNMGAVLRLTHAALSAMTGRGHGAVINVSSVAGFGLVQPGSTYAASKAWVTNFSESVGVAAARHGVRVMALCPGFTRTEFHERAGIDTAGSPEWMWLDAEDVVRVAFRDLGRGRLVSVPDWKYKAAVLGIRYTPHGLLTALTRGPRSRVGRDGV
jgi:short-subunit dehydrogenase